MFHNSQIAYKILMVWIGLLSSIIPSFGIVEHDSIFKLTLPTINHGVVDLSSLKNKHAVIIVFLSPECPLCKSYTSTLNQLYKEYGDKGIELLGVVPGKSYSLADIKKYNRKYQLDFKLLLDSDYKITRILNATVTPEVFLINSKGDILYSGKIDNWAVSIKRKRQVITEHYLNTAITATLGNDPIKLNRTQPVGCLIDIVNE